MIFGYSEGNGDFGGYESKPRIIDGTDMVYRNVLRSYSPSFNGTAEIPEGSLFEDTVLVDFYFDLDESWTTDNLKIIPILIKPDGTVDNAFSTSFSEAIETGIIKLTSSSIASVTTLGVTVFPNPAKNTLNVHCEEGCKFSQYQTVRYKWAYDSV